MAETNGREAQRRHVLEVATAFADRGFDAVQMREVAKEADVSLQTLYNLFTNKNLLLIEVLVEWLSEVVAEVAVTPVEGDTSAERMEGLLLRTLDHAVSREVRMRTCLQAFTRPEPMAPTLIRRFEGEFAVLLMVAFGDEVDDARQVAVLRVLGGVFYASLVAWMCERRSLDHVRDELRNAVAVTLGP